MILFTFVFLEELKHFFAFLLEAVICLLQVEFGDFVVGLGTLSALFHLQHVNEHVCEAFEQGLGGRIKLVDSCFNIVQSIFGNIDNFVLVDFNLGIDDFLSKTLFIRCWRLLRPRIFYLLSILREQRQLARVVLILDQALQHLVKFLFARRIYLL